MRREASEATLLTYLGMSANLADKAKKLGSPVWRFGRVSAPPPRHLTDIRAGWSPLANSPYA
jgi:hypothetical protein